ncbi:SDR family NAD(P)-dependent oxidoreductase [Microbacterium phyllosphaerae]|uniref:SDR family NAD(P)-dependent oxidoreductase n=1 Tax=Microbacterium phyllosphaerae TaxID=124798 RepID=UPI003D65B55C
MTTASFPDLPGAVALVTGSTRGIGAGLAAALEAAGVRVLRHGSGQSDVAAMEEVLRADLSDDAGVAQLARLVAERTDRLDLLVNNAGVEVPRALKDLDGDILRRTLDVNLAAPVLLTRALIPLLSSGRNRSVVNMTSIHDEVAYAGNIAYVASKAGLEAATRTMALELAVHGIRVNSIAPGAIETDMNREVIEQMGRHNFESWIPLKRVGAIDDLAGALLYLASDASRYVTGSRLVIDGGYSQALLRYGLDT